MFFIGVSVATVERIIHEGQKSLEKTGKEPFSSPKKKRVRISTVTDLPEYQSRDIRRIIHDFHKTENCRVNVRKLNEKIKKDLDISVSDTSLRRILKKLSFRWRKTENNRKLLVEKMEIRSLRVKYLRQIKNFRSQNRPIIFVDETYVHSGHTSSKSWTDNTTKGLFTTISKGNRLIIVHAGGEMGFIKDSLLMFKSGSKSGDYHDEMNGQNYRKWVEEKLIPNLPANSVVVCDNASYHNVQANRAPNSNSLKNEMIQWLTEKNIPFNPSSLKPELYQLIKWNKDRYVTYLFDDIFSQHGHTLLRLPPYHPDLNPIELIWATVKHNISRRNVTFQLNDVKTIAEEEFKNIDANEWKKRCDHVVKIENEYFDREVQTDMLFEINPVIISLDETGSSSSSEDDSESEDDN